jgi:hypothetical protein
MSVGLIDLSIMNDIANAINLKLSSSGTMTPSEMATNIISIPSGSGGAVLGSKTISINGVYNAIDDSLDGYDTVTIDVKSDAGTYDWYSDGVDVSVTVDDVNLSNYLGTNSFYETYNSIPINTLTINAGTSTSLSYFNSNPTKLVRFKKLVLGPGATRSADLSANQFYCMREIDI